MTIMCKADALAKYRKHYNLDKEEKLLIALRKQHEKTPITVSNQDGLKSKVCFVLSCPGREEMIAGKVCQGDTGANLNILLEYLNKQRPDLFPSPVKEEYDILNATNVVHFMALDGATEGNAKEIKEGAASLRRYLEGNASLKYAILLGNRAKNATEVFKEKAILCKHLGFQSLNQVKDCDITDQDGPEARRIKRIKYLGDDIIKQIEGKERNGNR